MPEPTFALAGKRVWVAGHRGMVGSALVRRLGHEDCEIVTVDRDQLDLRRQAEVEAWMGQVLPQVIFLAAAKVGGILANDTDPGDFLYDNLMIEANVIHGAHRIGVEKLLFLGSSCIYPREAPQPITEDALLSGPLEPTNEWYAVAKIAGIKLCQAYRRQYGCDFISAMPTNLYGPGDNYDLETSHVLPALLRKAHEAHEARGGAPASAHSRSGARAQRDASSCMSTTAPMPWSISWRSIPTRPTSMSAPGRRSPSRISPGSSCAWSGSTASSRRISPGPAAPRASLWTAHGSTR